MPILPILFFFILSFAFNLFNFGYAEQDISNNGTLIVVYETEPDGDRLDRIRFWLRDENYVQKMYPKEGSYVEDRKNMTRTVVIEDLKPGEYRLDFLIPNKDAAYEDSEERLVTIRPGEISKIDHHFKPREIVYHDAETQDEWMAWITFLASAGDEVGQIFPNIPPRQQHMGIMGGSLSVESNLPEAEWVLLRGDTVAYHGSGSISNLVVPAGPGYVIRAKPIEGFSIKVYPPGSFRIGRRQSFVARIVYERSFGNIEINAETPIDESIGVDITSENQLAPLHLDLLPQNGRLQWRSGPLPAGSYTVTFQAPAGLVSPSPFIFILHEDEHVQLSPDFVNEHNLTVESNTEEAIYVLQEDKTGKKWQGGGTIYTFKGIPAGRYTLNFASNNPDYLLPPEPKSITLGGEPEVINASYQITGRLNVEINADKAKVTIISQSNPTPTINDEVRGGRKSFQLLPGDYHVIIEQFNGVKQQKNQEVTLKAYETQLVKANFYGSSGKTGRQEQAQVVIITNLADAKFKILKKEDKAQKLVGNYQGKYVSVSLDPKVSYELIFEPLDDYRQPQDVAFELDPGEHRIIRSDYIPSQTLLMVPEGKVLLGDVFSEGADDEKPVLTVSISQFLIGKHEVTNALYATWLTKAVKEGKLIYMADFDKKGQVIDLSGHLICKTMTSDSYSQITVTQDSEAGTLFRAMPGRDNSPVIDVTWYGAQAYCADNKCRLPTEAEWERAAGMSLEKSEKLKKYRYGFSQDTIDKTWANYKYDNTPITNFQVLTTDVGFYNGINLLPLSSSDTTQLRTHDALSPAGAYDMSGNVFEWVSDWYAPKRLESDLKDPQGPRTGQNKIAKGGCYDSLAEELRVSKRLPLPPEHCDPYTGFRAAKSQ